MKVLKSMVVMVPLLMGAFYGYAQSSGMREPVSYTLKNGMTIITAENETTSKVYANLSFEATNAYQAEKATVQEVMRVLLHNQLNSIDEGLSYSDKGVNIATSADRFESVIRILGKYVSAPTFNQEAFVKAKATVIARLAANDKYFPETLNENSLVKLSLEDVNAYYREISQPIQMVLTVVGNIKPSAAKSLIKESGLTFIVPTI